MNILKLVIFSLIVVLFSSNLLLAVKAPPAPPPPSDPRFFGTYYGSFTAEVCRKYKVYFLGIPIKSGTQCKTVEVKDIRMHLDYNESPIGGFFTGHGKGLYKGDEIIISMTGEIIQKGKAWGMVGVLSPEYRTIMGNAYLSNDGIVLTANAFGRKIILRKDAGPNKTPKVSIDSPSNSATLQYGNTYVFSGKVIDEDTSFPPKRFVWHSNKDGVLSGYSTYGPKTASLYPNHLSSGVHTITFSATDGGGLTGSKSIQISVNNQAPDKPTIFKPKSNDLIYTSVNTVFLGQAYDLEEGLLSGTDLVWSSNVDGTIGYGTWINNTLTTPGTHKIRLTAKDQLGATSYEERMVSVLSYTGNAAPQVTITKPEHFKWKGMAVKSSDEITFVGTVADKEDSISKLTLKWQAFQIPPTGGTFGQVFTFGGNSTTATTSLSLIGSATTTYRIVLSATDSGGLTGTDSMILISMPHGIE
jgi:hypothetical protein